MTTPQDDDDFPFGCMYCGSALDSNDRISCTDCRTRHRNIHKSGGFWFWWSMLLVVLLAVVMILMSGCSEPQRAEPIEPFFSGRIIDSTGKVLFEGTYWTHDSFQAAFRKDFDHDHTPPLYDEEF